MIKGLFRRGHSTPSAGEAVHRASAIRFAALLLVLAGCASAERGPEDGRGATLEVVSRVREDVTIDVRGRVEAQVHAGTRARIHDLLPGTVTVVARSVTGGEGAFERKETLVLKSGERTTMVVLPDVAAGDPLAEPPELGGLVVENGTDQHLRVSVDGAVIGRVFAGATRQFRDLASGPHRLVALHDDGSSEAQVTLELVPGADTTWRVLEVGGTLRIENKTDEALAVAIDGAEHTRVAAGGTFEGVVPLGTHVFSAVSQPSRKPYESTLTIVAESAVTWTVTSGQAVVVVENHTGEDLTVDVAGQSLQVARGASLTIEDIPTGPVTINARAPSGMTYAGRVDLAPGQRAHWIAERVAGSVRVINRTGRKLWIYSSTSRGESEAGVLMPDAPALLRDLPRGAVKLAAVDPVGKRRYASEVDLAEVPAATWTIMPSTGSLAVQNDRDEPVTVYANAVNVGEVPPKSTRVFPGLGVGAALVESIGQRTGYSQKADAAVTEDRVALVVLPDPSAFVMVENATGETLATRGMLADQVATLTAGSVTRFRVRSGTMMLTVVGNDSNLVYQQELTAKADAPARWVVRQTPAALEVWNRMNETLAVSVDDRAIGSVAPDQSITIDGLAPGKRVVQAVGLGSGLLRSEIVTLAPGAAERMSFEMKLAALVIENRAAEIVSVTVDGRPWGDVTPGSTHGFANLGTGRHKVQFDYQRSRRQSMTEIEAREGQRVLVVAEVPMALVVVQNASRQATRVLVDGQPLTTVGADASPTLVHIPAGPRVVAFERLEDHTVVTYRLDFWADAAIHLPVPPKSARLVVVNREMQASEIRFGERVVGRIDANSSMIFEDLPDGTDTLTARIPGGPVTHSELRRFEPGETSTWVLEPTPEHH